jgi:plasmid replication initiation protein
MTPSNKRTQIANSVVNAKYSYTPLELDLMMFVLKSLSSTSGNNIEFHLSSLEKRYNTDSNSIYTDTKRAVSSLRSKNFEIFDKPNNSWLVTGFISDGFIKNGVVQLTISDKMKTILLDVKKEFTIIDFVTFMRLEGKHSKRLYLLLSQFKKTGYRIMNISELKEKFGLKEKYPNFSDLFKRVIDPAIKEINEVTNLNVTLEHIFSPNGRKVEAIKALINPKGHLHTVNYDSGSIDERAATRSLLKKYGLSDWQVSNIVSSKNDQEINQVIYRMKTSKKPVANTGAYLAASFKAAGVYLESAIPQQYDIEDMIAELEWEKSIKTNKQ